MAEAVHVRVDLLDLPTGTEAVHDGYPRRVAPSPVDALSPLRMPSPLFFSLHYSCQSPTIHHPLSRVYLCPFQFGERLIPNISVPALVNG